MPSNGAFTNPPGRNSNQSKICKDVMLDNFQSTAYGEGAPGPFGGASYLNGTINPGNHGVPSPSPFDFKGSAAFTLSCWWMSTNTGTSSPWLMGYGTTGGGNGYHMYWTGTANKYINCRYIDASAVSANRPSALVYNTYNVWNHTVWVAVTANLRATWQIYKNGVNVGWSGAGSNNPTDATYTGTTYIMMGNQQAGLSHNLTGSMTDFRIYNRALADSEVFAMYTRPWDLWNGNMFSPQPIHQTLGF